jgi:hypothetical protein
MDFMADTSEALLEKHIRQFCDQFGPDLRLLCRLLDDAKISHYASPNGARAITFDIFPAAAYVEEMLAMLSLERAYRVKSHGGYRDAKDEYNPANDFMKYLARWIGFAELTMQAEGVSDLGIAAAHAKLLMEELQMRLNVKMPIDNKSAKKTRMPMTVFAGLMADIASALELREKNEKTQAQTQQKTIRERNYLSALTAAKNSLIQSITKAKIA